MEETLVQSISKQITIWTPVVLSVIGTFSVIAAITPNKHDDKIVQWLLDIKNLLAANVGKAKNDPNIK